MNPFRWLKSLLSPSRRTTDSPEPQTPVRRAYAAIRVDDVGALRAVLDEQPELLHYSSVNWGSLLIPAAQNGSLRVAEFLLEQGVNVNQMDEKGLQTALWSAVVSEQIAMAEFLLHKGANPNLARTGFAAIRRDDETLGLQLIKLLVSHGLDLNQSFSVFGEQKTILEFAELHERASICQFLRDEAARARA